MKNLNNVRSSLQLGFGLLFLLGFCINSNAAVTDLASAPLASSANAAVRPNILFTLDDSGSMGWAYLPDYAGGTSYGGGNVSHCKVSNSCNAGEVPFQTNEYNGVAYNPRITYTLPVNADGTNKTNQNCVNTGGSASNCAASPYSGGWTTVKVDGFGAQSTGTINLTSGFPEVVYSNGGSAPYKKSGIDTNNPFSYRAAKNGTTSGAMPVPDTNDDAPLYSFPGSLQTGGAVVSTVYSGLFNQTTSTTSTVYNGSLDVSTSATVTNLSGLSVSRVGTTSTVSVTYNTLNPALLSGDTVIVSGSSCSSGYKSGGASRPITVVDATHFTYVSSAGTQWTKTSCSIQATHAGHTAVNPKISKSGNTVTVNLATAPVPALVNGALVNVANGAGSCDPGYQATSVIMNVTSSTSFTYTVPTASVNPSNAVCNITMSSAPAPASPGIRLAGTTVTVYLTGHGLSTGDVISVSDVTSGSCDLGYQTTSYTVTKIDANTFSYLTAGGASANSTCTISKLGTITTTAYTSASTQNGAPYYFTMLATEYCDSIYLTNCVASSSPTGAFAYPAPVRYCKDAATATLPPGDAGAQSLPGATINCQAKYSVGTGINFQYPRYGLFWRGDITPSRTNYGNETVPAGTKINTGGYLYATYPTNQVLDYSNVTVVDRSKRADCAAVPNCTYAEEMTNFANWYAYYRTRMQMMKSAAGLAFLPMNNNYRIGFVTINENSSAEYLPVSEFDATQKSSWYSKFYAIVPGNSTALRIALSHAGRYFAGKQPGILTGDPMEYSCQLNFDLITTDGYWNDSTSSVKQIDGSTTIGNYDNVDANPSLRSDGVYDGGLSGATTTLADTALYYYKTDLRDSSLSNCTGALGTDVCQNNVPMTDKDTQAGLQGTQNMKVFSLGLADGLMTYQKDYESALTGDLYKIKIGATGCPFSGSGTCNWPLPVSDSQTALDDLWHAAVNARGTYFNAKNPSDLTDGLSGAIAGINIRTAAAAASATSSPIITQSDNLLFSSTYRTVKWDGDVVARNIDPATGNVITTGVNNGVIWSAQAQLDSKVAADPVPGITSRHIYLLDPSTVLSGSGMRDFLYTNLSAAEQTYFDNKCTFTVLSQCTAATLTATEIASGNIGSNLVNYLRGDKSLESAPTTHDAVFRMRDHILGDTVNAKPSYVKTSLYSFTDPGYAAFKAAQASRQGALYMGANDGLLHAFNTTTGEEMWSYIPSIILPNLYKLAEVNYPSNHQYFVDGSPEFMDINVDTATSTASGLSVGWHTILVGGLGLGGRGYYALDVTDPLNPKGMWEICADSSLCALNDPDIGYSYGNPVITKRSSDGKWVLIFASGYNNVSPGSGKGTLFVLDVATGQVLSKTYTGAATNPPSGLSKISPWVDHPTSDLTTRYVYGGDLNGDVWRFDLGAVGSAVAPTATNIVTLTDSLGNPQSVTTRPTLGDPMKTVQDSLTGSGQPAVYIGTGRYLGVTDVPNNQIQSIYALKDDFSLTGAAALIANPRTLSLGGAASNSSAYPITQIFMHKESATASSTSSGAVDWSYDHAGWFMDFELTDSSNVPIVDPDHVGERVNLDPVLVSNTLIVITNIPQSSACTIGGTSWLHSFNSLTGAGTASFLANELAVGFDVVNIVGGTNSGGGTKVIVTKSGGDTATVTPPVLGQSSMRSSWRELP